MAVKVWKFSSLFLLMIILSVGVWLRWAGLLGHVTYIDELLLLTKGQLILSEQDLTSESLLGYVYKLFVSKTTSYGPFPVLIGKLIVGKEMFSFRALHVLRLISFLFSSFTLVFFAHVSRIFSSQKISGPVLLVVGVFACQMLQWVNAKQAHSYSAGPFAVLLSLELMIWFVKNPTKMKLVILFSTVGALCFFQYQFVLFVIAMGVSSGLLCLNKSNQLPGKKLILISSLLLLVYAVILVGVLSKVKGGLMSPYWLSSGSSVNKFNLHTLVALLRNLFDVFVVGHLFFANGENVVFAAAAVGLFALGTYSCFIECRDDFSSESFAVGSLFCFLALWVVAFLAGKTPISQTRHCMIFLAPILLIELKGLLALSDRMKRGGFDQFLKIASFAILALTVIKFPNYLEASAELFDASVLDNLVKKHQVNKIVAWDYDYSKLRFLGKDNFKPEDMLWRWNGNVRELPESRVALVELGSSSPSFEKNQELAAKAGVSVQKVFQEEAIFDFEPAREYYYGGNLFKVWLLIQEKK